MAKISIIVPAYNAEKYLDKCLSSLTEQTLSDLEFLLVDDGSSDHSGEICDIWAEKDGRVRVIHKENGGPQSAVIAGVKAASSAWIGFCDSDDYVAQDYFETLYRAMEESKADLVCCQFQIVYDDKQTQYCRETEKVVLRSGEIQKEFWEESRGLRIGNNRYTKLFRRDWMLDVLEELNPAMRVGEDAVQVLLYLERCGTVCCLTAYNGYFYRQVSTSLMNYFGRKQIDSSLLFVRELEETAKRYHHEFAARDQVSDSLMSSLLYKCAASDLKMAEKEHYADIIVGEVADKTHLTERYLSNLNPVLQYGFRLMLKGKIKTGMRFSAICIDLVQRIVGK